jgi:hypothetical protein
MRQRAAIICVALIGAAQAQAQQPAYPVPAQTYPGTPPAGPAQSYPAPNPAYPNPAYPNPGYPGGVQPYPGSVQPYPGSVQPYPGSPGAVPPLPQPSHFFRDLFAQTLAVVLQTTTGGLLGTIAGRIMEWFTHKGYNAAAMPAPNSGYPGAAYASTAPGYPNASYPQTAYPTGAQVAAAYPTPQSYPSQAPAYPAAAYPTAGAPAAYGVATSTSPATYGTTPSTSPATYGATPSTSPATYGATPSGAPVAYGTTPGSTPPGGIPAYGTTPSNTAAYGTAPPQVYDATTGQLVTGAANPYATRGVEMENAIYAGIAYEVQIMGADGQTTPVNTATYEFHTGDKFMLIYRPSLPGHMEIYNINAAGQKTLIDSSDMAAGQMTKLGPYQFANQAGDESLRLVLTPCSNPQLQAKTRDIVKLGATPTAAGGKTLKLPDCSAPTTRGVDVQTRDIQKVGVEDTTSFALDPLSPKEMISGQVAPREAIVVFHHR